MWQLASAGLVLETTAPTRSAQSARSISTERGTREMSAPPARTISRDQSRWPPNERVHPTACAGPRSSRTIPPASVSVRLGRGWLARSVRAAPTHPTRRARATLGAPAVAPTSPPTGSARLQCPAAPARPPSPSMPLLTSVSAPQGQTSTQSPACARVALRENSAIYFRSILARPAQQDPSSPATWHSRPQTASSVVLARFPPRRRLDQRAAAFHARLENIWRTPEHPRRSTARLTSVWTAELGSTQTRPAQHLAQTVARGSSPRVQAPTPSRAAQPVKTENGATSLSSNILLGAPPAPPAPTRKSSAPP